MREPPIRPKKPPSGPALPLPHERDESPHPAEGRTDPRMRQAQEDLAAGQVDTDMRATPGIDATRRERLVPGPGGRTRATKRGA